MTSVHVADTGLFVALGGPDDDRYRAVRRFARRNDVTFLLPRRVYEELTSASDAPPVETAIENGWTAVADEPRYANPVVSRAMDGVQRYVASTDDRRADEIERADAALAGLAAERLTDGDATDVFCYTTDIAAGRAVETVLASEGYGDSVTFVNGFRFVEDTLDEL